MKTPGFWSTDGLLPRLLSPVSFVWGRVAAHRMAAPASCIAPVAVVAIGNFTAGGAGKTPTVLALTRLARAAGFHPAVVSRGHGGRESGPLLVDPTRHLAADVGDEPLLLAQATPTVVSHDRCAGARLAADGGADLIFLDDGFQNPALHRDLALVVVDRAQGIGNGRVLPAGPLRAPLDAQFDRADALVVIDTGEATAPSTEMILTEAARRHLPVFAARLAARAPETLAGRRVLAFAGIGRPEKFAATLRACGAEVTDLVAFGDHAPLSEADAARLLARAEATGALPVTTAKDAARMAGETSPARVRLAEAMEVVEVDLTFENAKALTDLLIETRHRRLRGEGLPQGERGLS